MEQALAASFVARRAKADVAKDLLNKDRPPTADDIRQALEDGGWAKELRIKVHELHKQATTEKILGKDSLASVQKARKQWEASINDELRAIASERRVPLVRKRKKIINKKEGGRDGRIDRDEGRGDPVSDPRDAWYSILV